MHYSCVHKHNAVAIYCRWNKWKYDQWWEVKFVGEGIIDQGGGFRDSLAELSDELCPPEEHIPDVLPYLIRTPNSKVHGVSVVQVFVEFSLSRKRSWHVPHTRTVLFAVRVDANIISEKEKGTACSKSTPRVPIRSHRILTSFFIC